MIEHFSVFGAISSATFDRLCGTRHNVALYEIYSLLCTVFVLRERAVRATTEYQVSGLGSRFRGGP